MGQGRSLYMETCLWKKTYESVLHGNQWSLRTRIDYGKNREESVHVIACVCFLCILVWTCEHWHMHGCAALIKTSCVQSPEQKVKFLTGWQLTRFGFPLIWHRGMLLGTESRHLKAGLIYFIYNIRERVIALEDNTHADHSGPHISPFLVNPSVPCSRFWSAALPSSVFM